MGLFDFDLDLTSKAKDRIIVALAIASFFSIGAIAC